MNQLQMLASLLVGNMQHSGPNMSGSAPDSWLLSQLLGMNQAQSPFNNPQQTIYGMGSNTPSPTGQ